MSMPKFMQTLDNEIHNQLVEIAKARGISVQELIRAVIIPEWLKQWQKFERNVYGTKSSEKKE